ncbi:MAG: stage II sporulation protein M [Anaerolineae bacterium]|nr:stage II sporulation protein M [Anaerolineae bacterium]
MDSAIILTPSIEQTGKGVKRWFKLLRWNLSRALIITRREVVDMYRDWRILAPIIILTIIFPSIANWGAGRMMQWVSEYGAEIVGERLVPFLLMVVGFFPISFSLIIALESFVGEKERRSLEPLLSTPLTNVQLYIGKTLSSTIPPLLGSLLGITVYLVGVYFNIDYRPPFILLVQIILLTIAQALIMVSGAVIVSSQTTSVRAANLLSSFIIIPMSFLVQAEAIIMFWARYNVLWWIFAGLLLLDIVLVRMGVRAFNREELIGREIDELNLYAIVKKWWRLVWERRPGQSFWMWYREKVFGVVWQIRYAVVLIVLGMTVGYFIGIRYARIYVIPPEVFVFDDWYTRFSEVLIRTGLHGLTGVLLVIGQNLRVLVIASVLAVFSFGILLVLILMVPTALVGYLVSQMVVAGMEPAVLWAALIPHSLLEIPAAILAGAVALRLGASIISPPPGKTIGEGWMVALADATRLWIVLIMPVLVVAAAVEIYVTPAIVLWIAGG